jgi:ABC-type Na+ transport system ATPase subunit NatA
MREAMKIMGLTDLPYWLSWLTYYMTINTIQCVIMILILIPVFEHSNKLLIFIHLWIYGMTMFGYGLFVGAFFSNGKTAAVVATMFFYLTSFLTELVGKTSVSETAKTLASFLPAVGVQLAGTNLLEFESSGVGLGFSNASESYQSYKFGTCVWMNVLSFFVFSILGLYLENVLPSAAGVRKPLWFPFTKTYWCGSGKKSSDEHEGRDNKKIANSSESENVERGPNADPDNFEEVPENLKQKAEDGDYLKIVDLKKKFEQGFLAINNLNAEMYEDQIFALLGHNGAGKTTTINVLCGMMSSTSGEAEIYGHDIKTDMRNIRKFLGYCPQHNILFPKLTVREHLSVFADFKGMPKAQIKDEIDQLLKDLNLTSRKDVLSKDLSGGYKRKLSLGIALIGGSKVVFLDEPSSGMDVTARREMWDMLKKYKNDRIIILTTHYMEEADNLGDRIGIMSRGQMLC